MPVATFIGHHAGFHLVRVWNGPCEVDELEAAGNLVKEPLKVCPAQTVDLLVPPDAEAIIGGEMHLGVRELERPFSEFTS